MTKRVRVENADTSSYGVVVQVWDKGAAGPAEGENEPDSLVEEILLGHPTAITPESLYITSTRYLVVKEVP